MPVDRDDHIPRRTKLNRSTYRQAPSATRNIPRSRSIKDNQGGIGKQPYSTPISDIEAVREELPPAMKHLPEELYQLAQFQDVRRWITTEPRSEIITSDIGSLDDAIKYKKKVKHVIDIDDENAKGLSTRYSKASRIAPAIQGFISAWFVLFKLNAQAPACYKLTDAELTKIFRLLFTPEKYPSEYCEDAKEYRHKLRIVSIHSPANKQPNLERTRCANLLPLENFPENHVFPRYAKLLRYTAPTNSVRLNPYRLKPSPQHPVEVIYRIETSGRLLKQLWPSTAAKRVLIPRINNNYPGFYLEDLAKHAQQLDKFKEYREEVRIAKQKAWATHGKRPAAPKPEPGN